MRTTEVKILVVLSMTLLLSNVFSQNDNFIEVFNTKFLLSPKLNSESKIYEYRILDSKETKIDVPDFYEDMNSPSLLTGRLIRYLDYFKIDSMLIDMDFGVVDFDKVDKEEMMKLKIFLKSEFCWITEFKLYLIYDKTRRFQLDATTDAVELLKRFGKPEKIIISDIEYQDSNNKNWNLPHTFLWRIK